MKGSEFLRRIRTLASKRAIPMRFESKRGKGSHGTLYWADKRTIVQDLKKELKPGTLHAMLRQIGLTEKDLQ